MSPSDRDMLKHSPYIMHLDALFKHAALAGASDVHCSSGEPPVLRIHGALEPLDGSCVHRDEEFLDQLAALISPSSLKQFLEYNQVDCACELDGVGRFRMNIFRHSRGIAAAVRLIPDRVPSLSSLGLPPIIKSFAALDQGLVLVTGPTGSGKSTTLAALVESINISQGMHVVTIEDPIEFVYSQNKALIRQREVAIHTQSFSQALRAALREDPDVILIGELRDLETTHLALTAAETGHLVLASVHSARAHSTVDRIVDFFPSQQQPQVRAMLAGSLQGIVTQRLYDRVGGGRVAAAEILVGTPAVRNLIREAKTHQLPGTMQVSRGVGMQTFETHLDDLRCQGLIGIPRV
jgi:twitching motility protein PilT